MNLLGFPFIQIECQRAGVQSMNVQITSEMGGHEVCSHACQDKIQLHILTQLQFPQLSQNVFLKIFGLK